jgi:hypothetical protein
MQDLRSFGQPPRAWQARECMYAKPSPRPLPTATLPLPHAPLHAPPIPPASAPASSLSKEAG